MQEIECEILNALVVTKRFVKIKDLTPVFPCFPEHNMRTSQYFIASSFLVFSVLAGLSFGQSTHDIGKFEQTVVAICHTEPNLANIMGTGFIVSQNGLLLTADHVIADNNGKPHAVLWGIRPVHPKVEFFRLTIVRRSRKGNTGRDIALLRIDSNDVPTDLPYLPIGENARVGEEVVIAGFPKVFDKVFIWPFFRMGTVASTRYSVEGASILVLDLASVEGFSGSPVISLESNKVVGVLKGGSQKRRQTDFSAATRIYPIDIQIKKDS
jgi:S1-C subfamily serine protease